jgi:phospholipase/carboxylesterase
MTRWLAVPLAVLALACGEDPEAPAAPDQETIDKLTLTPAPHLPTQTVVPGTTVALGLASVRDAELYIPTSYDPTQPTPLIVHLSFFRTPQSRAAFIAEADARNIALLFVNPRLDPADGGWDIMVSGIYGPDVAFIDRALDAAYDYVNVHPVDLYMMGAGGGGAYALAVGAANAGIFRRLAAFSPVGLFMPYTRGFPPIYVADGSGTDSWFQTRDSTVPRLREMGFLVEFATYQGSTLPGTVLSRGFDMLFEQ